MERIKRFKDFNESQDATLTSTMSMRTPNAAMSSGMNTSNPFTMQRLNQIDVIGDITKDAVGEVEEEEDDETDDEDLDDEIEWS